MQRPLWASTSTKNPAYPDVYYIDALVGPDTVNTMPPTHADRVSGSRTSREPSRFRDRRGPPRDESPGRAGHQHRRGDRASSSGDGVASFVASWDTLVAGIAARRDALEFDARATLKLGSASRAVDAALATLDAERVGERLARRDPPASRESSLETLRTFAGELRAAGVRRAVLCGFGGSVLMARALRDALGVARGAIDVDVLDSTHPDAVRAITERKGTEAALWVVVDPSGTSPESDALIRLAWERSGRRGDRCVAVTTAGSALEASARERGFLRVFADPSGSDHRFGALSFATLVPAALLGVDMAVLLERAEALHRASAGGIRAAHHPALPLAAALAAFARAGRDKLTILAGDGLAALAEWIGQLVAGGLGKRGTGIVPVVGEGVGKTSTYGRDRFFVALEIDGHPLRAADTLARAGHPVIRYRLRDGLDLGAECLRWEIAIAAAAHLLGVDPVDEPDMHATADGAIRLLAAEMPPTTADALAPDDPAVATRLSAMLRSAGARAWVAINAWTAPVGRRAVALDELRALLRDRFGVATVAGFAPASLRTIGQLQHGGPATGIVLHLTTDVSDDVAVPGLAIGFGTLTRALALADVDALAAHQRRVLHVDLGSRAEHGMHLLVATLKAQRRRPPRPVRSGRSSRTAARRARR